VPLTDMQVAELLATQPSIIEVSPHSDGETTFVGAWLGYTREIELIPREDSIYYDVRVSETHARAEPIVCKTPDSSNKCFQLMEVVTVNDFPLPCILD
jgi:hypothetical protein